MTSFDIDRSSFLTSLEIIDLRKLKVFFKYNAGMDANMSPFKDVVFMEALL